MPDSISDDLALKGWSVRENYFSPGLISALHHDLEERQQQGLMEAAGIGRAVSGRVQPGIRNDVTFWLAECVGAQKQYLHLMENLRLELNRALVLGLFEFEAHYACYPAGGFYHKHIDALKGQRNRVVSTVTYLTPGWGEDDAGHLVLYDPEQDINELVRILPVAGTLAIFMSEEIPHEVCQPNRARASIAGWFRCREGYAG